jgi:hypothetical protein
MYSVSKHDKRTISANEEVLLEGLPLPPISNLKVFSTSTIGFASRNTNLRGQYNFCEDNSGWGSQTIIPTGTNAHNDNDVFGYRAVGTNVDLFISSKNDYDESGSNSVSNAGAVYVFTRFGPNTNWTFSQKIVSSSRSENESFGNTIDFNGTDLFIVDGDDVKVYNNGSGPWTLIQTITTTGTPFLLASSGSRLTITTNVTIQSYLKLSTWVVETGPDNIASANGVIGVTNTKMMTSTNIGTNKIQTKYIFDRDSNSWDFQYQFDVNQGDLPQVMDGLPIDFNHFNKSCPATDLSHLMVVFHPDNHFNRGFVPLYVIGVWKLFGNNYVYDYSFSATTFLADIDTSGNVYTLMSPDSDVSYSLIRRNKIVVS